MSIQVYKGEILLSEPELANTQWEKAKGLMFSRQHDVLFHFPEEKRLHFHMVFVFYPIDIVFLDDDLKIVDLKLRFRPFTFYYSKAKSSTVIESYDGFINDHSLKVGDELSIVHEGEINMTSDAPPEPPALERKAVFHGTSLGRPREAKVAPGGSASEGIAPASKRSSSAKSTKASEKPSKVSSKKSASKSSAEPKRSSSVKSKSSKRSAAKSAASKKKSSTKRSTSKKSPAKNSSKPKTSAAKTTKKSSAKSPKRSSKASSEKSASKKPAKSSKRSSKKTNSSKKSSK